MIERVVLIFSGGAGLLVLALGIAAFVRARNTPASNACINNLRHLNAVKQQWAVENSMSTNAMPTWEALRPYMSTAEQEGRPVRLVCPEGGVYLPGRTGDAPTCSIGGPDHTLH